MTQKRDKGLHQSRWVRPDADGLQLQFSIADSVLREFVLGHGASAVLTELVQNEYDAQGGRLEVLFGEDSVTVTGNGKVVDRKGWNRLSVVMGTGLVAGTDRRIEAKVNSIGSKNFGLRSLFNYGDTIYIRSGGRQTVLDLHRGALPKPLRERYSQGRPGIHIEVPYRIRSEGDLEAFDAQKEALALDQFSRDIMPMLVKLADPGSSKSLQEVIVASRRCNRRLVWKQSVSEVPGPPSHKFRVLSRTTTMRGSSKPGVSSTHTAKLEEIEFQKHLRVPEELKQHRTPDYFRRAGGSIRLALSLRHRRGKVDISDPGLFYYPLGLLNAYTGTAVSVNAPFQLDDDRTRIIDTENSRWNAWLLKMAAEFTVELLVSDWVGRFGSQAYLALDEVTRPAIREYLDCVTHYLHTEQCWPTRARERGRIRFVAAHQVVMPEGEHLDGFLVDDRYLDSGFSGIPEIREMVCRCGARSFTVNSLVRLRCFGGDTSGMTTKLGPGEASLYYTDFPNSMQDTARQVHFAAAIDTSRRRLSHQNRQDLSTSPITLTEAGGLQAPVHPLWIVDQTIAEVCPVPRSQRLHPALISSQVIRACCREFDMADWVRRTAQRIATGRFEEDERVALYRYILSVHGHLNRTTQASLRKLPVLKNHRNQWVTPCSIMTKPKKAGVERQLEPVLHFPHRDYATDAELAKALRFSKEVDGEDLVAYARTIQHNPQLAEGFEETLQRLKKKLTRRIVARLCDVTFMRRCSEAGGGISAPKDLYVRNQLNYVCLGAAAPYVRGSRSGLYRLLGCKETPEADDIRDHLERLSARKERPGRPEVIYTTLAGALSSEGFPCDSYSAAPIVWNGSGYSSPEETLLGSHYRKVFLDAVPCIAVPSSKLRDAFLALGVCREPLESHWRQLLVWFGNKYGKPDVQLPLKERSVLRNAYIRMGKMPNGLDDDVKCLLDRNGRLHSRTDVQYKRLLADDDPPMARAITEEDIPLAFVDTSEHGNYRFFRHAGVKTLTDVRQLTNVTVGAADKPPRWVNAQLVLQQLRSPAFCSALLALAEHEPSGYESRIYDDPVALQSSLDAIQDVRFVKDIRTEYEIGGHCVSVSEDSRLVGTSVVLAGLRSRSELYRLLARITVTMLSNDIAQQRVLADSVFILLTCRSVREVENYLNGKGIPWKPAISAVEDWCDGEEEPDDFDSEADIISDAVANAFRSTMARGKTGDSEQSDDAQKTKAQQPEEKEPKTARSKQFSLPPLSRLRIRRLKAEESWMPPPTTGGGRRGSYVWTPSQTSDDERDKMIGRRGEEIVYHDEIDRVRGLGYPESRVVWIADAQPGANFDILSVDDDGEDLWIEVKATTGTDGRFRWPRSEFVKAVEKRNRYILWRVYQADSLLPSTKPFRDPVGILLRQGMRLDINTFNAMIEPMEP